MRYTTDTGHPFDTDNRAYRRFLDITREHLTTVVVWTDDHDRPLLATLQDPASGDLFTVQLIDSHDMRDIHILLAFTSTRALTAHGPFAGEPAADTYAPHLAMSDPTVAATRTMPLHRPADPYVADDLWKPVPPAWANTARPAPVQDRPLSAVVLLDHARHVLAAVGPFRDRATADAWRHTPDLGPDVDRLVVPLRPATPARCDG